MPAATIIHGDARHLPLDDCTVDAVICDPPYELTSGTGGSGGFMGKKWDATGVAFDPATWREALRVLKPGGFLLAFGGMRTQHRLICAIEDAGFEIRDAIVWHFASGFPKSLDVSKAVDAYLATGKTNSRAIRQVNDSRDVVGTKLGTPGKSAGQAPSWSGFNLQDDGAGRTSDGKDIALHMERYGTSAAEGGHRRDLNVTAPATDEARRWQGYGTALKPASEIICVARKPLAGKTVAQNVLAYGCGALNIDATRVEGPAWSRQSNSPHGFKTGKFLGAAGLGDPSLADDPKDSHVAGRWPSNVVFSHVALTDVDGQVIGDACADGCVDGCPVLELDTQSGVTKSPPIGSVTNTKPRHSTSMAGAFRHPEPMSNGHGDSGGASRYFPTFRYQAKAPSRERPKVDGVAHPTCKPLTLLKFLCRLVGGQPGSLILDPFAGSGTTLEAALLEGFNAVGVEQAAEYLPLIQHRIDRATAALAAQQAEPEAEPTLFDVA